MESRHTLWSLLGVVSTTMDFFESQDTAKRNTTRLVVMFILAVLSLIVLTNLLVLVAFGLATPSVVAISGADSIVNWRIVLAVTLGVLAVVGFGSLYKLLALAGGGARVAEMLNGRLILGEPGNINERRVQNVVEEMAIASGTPIPPVYVLEEKGINAFAAGYTPEDAVIGITSGAIETLSRDQLQGVIAHEFSHILHGDMRINIRLIAILHGILVLGIIGNHLLRGGSYSRRSKESGGMVALGLGLVIVGFVGTFFGNLIKAAISRQREFLADASAVQFTRNPEGIAGALMQIAANNHGSYLVNANAMEISHALFEEGVRSRFRNLYATHPPLDARIKAILPNWDGSYEPLSVSSSREADGKGFADSEGAGKAETDKQQRLAALSTAATAILAEKMIDHIGQPDMQGLAQARELLRQLPVDLIHAVHDPSAARAVIYLLVLNAEPEARKEQLDYLASAADVGIYAELENLLSRYNVIDVETRLPLLYLALNSLRQLSSDQYQLFKTNLTQLIESDKKVSSFEWALQKIVFKTLASTFEKQQPAKFGRKELIELPHAIEILLSVLARTGARSESDAETAFIAGTEYLGINSIKLLSPQEISLRKLDTALEELGEVQPLHIPRLLKACVSCITQDDKVDAAEIELLRAIGIVLDCPIPPIASSAVT